MTASPYDMSYDDRSSSQRRFSLPKVRAAAFGGGFGLLVIAIGLLVIGLGWNGMAGGGGEVNGVPNLNAQLPWLVSGGILGLALVVFGAAMVVVHNARTDRARLEAKLDELIGTVSRPSAAAAYPAEAPASQAGVFVAGGTAYHAQSCRLVQGRDDVDRVTVDEAQNRGLRACRVCKPSADAITR